MIKLFLNLSFVRAFHSDPNLQLFLLNSEIKRNSFPIAERTLRDILPGSLPRFDLIKYVEKKTNENKTLQMFHCHELQLC